MIQVQNVTKKYGRNVVANDDISLEVRDKQIAVLLGPNGAGKSTLIKCITGLLRFEGDIAIDGWPNKTLEAKRQLGYIPEMPAVYDLLTVGEHLQFIARAYSLSDNWQAYADTLLARFEMRDKTSKLGKELSKGMQQKLSIMCALLPQPHVAIFDEPLIGLDPHAIKELKLMFREMRAAGCSLLISTHMLDSVEDFWDVAHIMDKGKVLATRNASQEAASDKSLEDLFFELTEHSAGEEQV